MATAVTSLRATSARSGWRWAEFPVAAVLLAVAVAAGGLEPRAVPLVYLAAVTPALCSIDIAERRLPNRLVLPAIALGLVGVGAQWVVIGDEPGIALASGGGFLALMLAFALAGGMGMGDAKLAAALGLAAGSLGMAAAVLAPVAAFLIGGIAAIGVLVRERRSRGGPAPSIPFGPFLLAGFWIAVVLA